MAENTLETICVIIAAKNASATIATAIRSALNEAAVAEVVVVDDGSSDGTAQTACQADDGSGRLKIVSFEQNKGPSAARNHAIAASTAPLIAILDADDFFFAGRFDPMLQEEGWDFIADNIAFTSEPDSQDQPEHFQPRARQISLTEFIDGNISKRGQKRGEIGFLKPVMRRAFLDQHALRYNDDLRLGEDYDLYVRALARGARYKVIEHCGYGAVVRHDSLSGRHSTQDLRRLYEADSAIRAVPGLLSAEADAAILAHEKHIRDRYELREFLDVKSRAGKGAAIRHVLSRPGALPAIVTGIFYDKLDASRGKPAGGDAAPATGLRYLLQGIPVAQK